MEEIKFAKYKERGSFHLNELMSKDIRKFNAYHMARYKWILRTVGDIRDKKVLDLGCGDGLLTYFLAKAGAHVVGVDNEELGLTFAKKNLESLDKDGNLNYEFVHSSAYELKLEDESFDVVVNCEVIEHLNEPEKMLSEISRVLKKDGAFVITTPYKITEFPQDVNHRKEYYPEELKSMVSKYLGKVEVKSTHHMLWRSLYTYGFHTFGNRPLGKWFINSLVLFFGWDPFMIDYKKPAKFDTFTTICVFGVK